MAPSQARRRLFSLLILLSILASSAASGESEALLRFRSFLTNSAALSNWNESAGVCAGDRRFWTGVICKNGTLRGLWLDNMNLSGAINTDSLANLQNLRVLRLENNGFEGPMPEVKKLSALRSLLLSRNGFSGEISDSGFEGMRSLRRLYLAENRFSGRIPSSLAGLPALVELGLEGNQFAGGIPEFSERDWTYLNLSNNHLEGPIPSGLKNLNSSFTSFLGNEGLCGEPFPPCKSPKTKWYILIGAISGTAAAALLLLFLRRLLRPSKLSDDGEPRKRFLSPVIFRPDAAASPYPPSDSYEIIYKKSGRGHGAAALYFVRSDRPKFDFQELLGASAEVLGGGSFGSTYKAVLSNGSAVAVKRFRQMNGVGKDEFYSHMRRLGRLSHQNLLPLVAFYCGRDDKLLISDFVGNGSLASHLHARRAPGTPGLSWPTRLKIIKGVARGLAHLHKELPHLALPHGHLKSSNVLLDQAFNPILSDYALAPVVDRAHARTHMAAFKSPECAHHDRGASKSTDVWSLGILILELLTGKFPANYLRPGKGASADLAAWVDAVVREEWTAEVFDADMAAARDGGGEMLKLLKIGMCCCEWEVGRRWGLGQAVERIEELREWGGEGEDDDQYYSSYDSERDLQFSRGRVEDESSFLG